MVRCRASQPVPPPRRPAAPPRRRSSCTVLLPSRHPPAAPPPSRRAAAPAAAVCARTQKRTQKHTGDAHGANKPSGWFGGTGSATEAELARFYRQYAPEMVPKASTVLKLFENHLAELQEKCKQKYGAAPRFSSSALAASTAASPSSKLTATRNVIMMNDDDDE